MKKLLLALLAAVSLQAADNDLYDNGISLYGGYGFTGDDAGALYGLRIDRNLNTSEGTFNLDALQFVLEYARFDAMERDYAVRIGINALWYIETNEDWMPFVKVGAGIQGFGGDGTVETGNHFYATLGGGIEYQIRPDTSVMLDLTDHLSASGENTVKLTLGLKYSFGQSY